MLLLHGGAYSDLYQKELALTSANLEKVATILEVMLPALVRDISSGEGLRRRGFGGLRQRV